MGIWSGVVSAVAGIAKSWIDSKKAKYEAEKTFQMKMAEMEATWDLIALRQAQYSLKDEIITIIIFFPLVAWWFPSLRPQALAWAEFVTTMPYWYQMVMFGIVAASFGLRWWFGKQGFKVKGSK